jgi:hypothetical protein
VADVTRSGFVDTGPFYNQRHRHSLLDYLSPATFDRRAVDPGAHYPAAVLAPVKERPGSPEPSRTDSLPAVPDRRFARRPAQAAGRDGKMIAAEPKDAAKKQQEIPSDRIP